MKQPHVFDPAHVDVLEAEDRRLWQNPDEILNAVEIKPNFVATDVGCGSGYFTVPLAKKVKKVYAIDVQKEMLSFLEDKLHRLKIRNIKLLLSGQNEIPLEDEKVDFLLTVNTLHEFSDKDNMIKEVRRS